MKTSRPISQTTAAKIKARIKSIYSQPKSDIRDQVKRHYRVCDLRDADKHTLASMLVEAAKEWLQEHADNLVAKLDLHPLED